jgi:hypothetical protein
MKGAPMVADSFEWVAHEDLVGKHFNVMHGNAPSWSAAARSPSRPRATVIARSAAADELARLTKYASLVVTKRAVEAKEVISTALACAHSSEHGPGYA